MHQQGRSQISKAVSQIFMKVFKVNDVTANDVIQENQHRYRKRTTDFP